MTAPDLLVSALHVAVPLRIAELQQLNGETRTLQALAWARDAVDPLAARSDIMLFRGGRRGEAAQVFGHMARGLAALAHNPGGVLFAGTHWCVEHPWGRSVGSITELTCGSAGMEPLPGTAPPIVTVELPDAIPEGAP